MMAQADAEPELTFPEEVAAHVRAAYGQARVILEYGSGGSTLLGARLPGRRVVSVESDAAWAARMEAILAGTPLPGTARIHHVDIGPTKDWGRPRRFDPRHLGGYRRYPVSVWQRPDFEQPDLVLIDGRFRVGCFLATLANTARPVRVLFDDYANRPAYHVVERLVQPHAVIGRMAEFTVPPRPPGRWQRLAMLRRALSPE